MAPSRAFDPAACSLGTVLKLLGRRRFETSREHIDCWRKVPELFEVRRSWGIEVGKRPFLNDTSLVCVPRGGAWHTNSVPNKAQLVFRLWNR